MRANLRRAFSVFLLAVLAYGAVALVSTSNANAECKTCPPGCTGCRPFCAC
jgi:hypothetical protein